MMRKADHNSPKRRVKQRQTYWSVMLVGEHGRVIPFRYFKELTIGVLVLLLLMIAGVAAISFLYIRQNRIVEDLRTELTDARAQAAAFRDEKDMLLAELVLLKKPDPKAAAKPVDSAKAPPVDAADDPPSGSTVKPDPPVAAKAEKAEKPPQSVELKAKLSHFDADYDPARGLLTLQVRIHNDTPGRKPLSGRVVVVLCDQDDPDVQRVSIPAPALEAGEPVPKLGQAFSLNNYRTMTFKLYNPRTPVSFNTAEIYLFSPEGQPIHKEAFDFSVTQQQVKTPPTQPAGEVRAASATLPQAPEDRGDSDATSQTAEPDAEGPAEQSDQPIEPDSPISADTVLENTTE